MTIRLSIRNLGVRYSRDGQDVEALKQVALDLKTGECLAVIGESGSGKSTLALAIAGLLPSTAKLDGDISWPGLGRAPQNGRDIGFVFQDPSASLNPVLTVGEQIAEVVRTHLPLTWREACSLATDLLGRVRLPDPEAIAHVYPHQLSGGQKQRVAIAAAIAARPSLLITDEATSALDTIVQAEIVALIRRLVAEDAMSLLFISHDIALAAQLADRIAVFRHGRLLETGGPAVLLRSPTHPYTRSLIEASFGPAAEKRG
ncbi:ABC transporter ATP-binding protein [Mesorhizobium sp. WSM2239]|uniref:ABC transporter ATP-binding protein n=2 Tax=unclassified Mesorhizobium TaxID=325217 RepID=A0AAU8DBD6_9HYPH